jgi:tetratricopeptide (TPR) repeat protein
VTCAAPEAVMEGIPREDLERLMFLEQMREQAMLEFQKNPNDVNSLVKLGRAQVELAQFVNGPDAMELVNDAMSNLSRAVNLDGKKHEAYWWLGNAHATQAFQTIDAGQARDLFGQARQYYRQALDVDPTNENYQKSLEVAEKGPELHQEIHKQLAQQQAIMGAGLPGPSGGDTRGGKKKKSNDFYYDAAGWVILTVALAGWLAFINAAKPQVQN